MESLEKAISDGKAPEKYRFWFTIARGVANYRIGNFEQTIASIHESQLHEDFANTPSAKAKALSILAMAEHRLDHAEQAKEALREATELLDQYWTKPTNRDWHDWAIAETLCREAAALLTE